MKNTDVIQHQILWLHNEYLKQILLCLTGYSPALHPSSSKQPNISIPAEVHDSGLQEHRASSVLEVSTEENGLVTDTKTISVHFMPFYFLY